MRSREDIVRSARLFVMVLAVVGVLTASASTHVAYALTSHNYESVISEVPSGLGAPVPGPLDYANSLTAHAGDLYVAEDLDGINYPGGDRARTDQFAPAGSSPVKYEFVSQLPVQEPRQDRYRGIAFGTAAGETEMYMGQSDFPGPSGINVFSTGLCGTLECASLQDFWMGAGAPSVFSNVVDVVTDSSSGTGTSAGDWASGDVFVVDEEHSAIDIFEPVAGGPEKYVGQMTGVSPGQIAVSGYDGDLAVAQKGTVSVFRPEEEGPKRGKYTLQQQLQFPVGAIGGWGVTAVAVDDGNGEIYAATQNGIYEFGPEGAFRGDVTGVPREGIPTGTKGESEEIRFNENTARPVSLAVDPLSHHVFVGLYGSGVGPRSNNLAVVDVLSSDVVVPDPVTGELFGLKLTTDGSTGRHSWSLFAAGTVNPDEAGVASCWFAWGTSKQSLNRVAPCRGTVPNVNEEIPVDASLTGLEPDTTYYYRLETKNANGTNMGEESQDYEFTTPGPGLEGESVSAVSSAGATFEATVVPHGSPVEAHDLQAVTKSPTTYYFQYSTGSTDECASRPSACTSVPLSPVSAGSGNTGVEVEQAFGGLVPSTTYHYRLVAINEALPESQPGVLVAFYGPDQTFTMQPAGSPFALPDGRAWELVSPVNKHGAQIGGRGLTVAAVGGEKFAFTTVSPTEPAATAFAGIGNEVLSSRVAPGVWGDAEMALSHGGTLGAITGEGYREYQFFSEDLGLSVAQSLGPFSLPEGWHQSANGEWERIVEASPVPTERTPYLRHDTTCHDDWSKCYEPLLNKEDVTSGLPYNGKIWNEGPVTFAGATPDASHIVVGSAGVQLTATKASKGGLYEWSADKPMSERLSLVSILPDGEASEAELASLSGDGSRFVFGHENALAESGDAVFSHLYLRDTASGAQGETIPLGVNEAGVQAGPMVFGGASIDDSSLFFVDGAPLMKDSGFGTTTRLGYETGDLYVCEVAPAGLGPLGCSLTDITSVPPVGQPGAREHAEVERVLGVSRDGNYVYFVAEGVQAAGAVPGGQNVYVAHRREGGWTTSLIASPPAPIGFYARMSPDGEWLAFSSGSALTRYDNRDVKTGKSDSEVYLYNAARAKLLCASCDPTGGRPVGSAEVPAGKRVLLDNGRLFFDSADALVSQDTNGNVDAYEFEPVGVPAGEHACSAESATFNAATGGCVSLISSGVGYGSSEFMEASATGGDVFFTTLERLVVKDVDTSADVYDAHECTPGSPCAPPEATALEECVSAASCRTAPTPQPSVYGTPSSATFSGAGNVVPATHEPTSPKRKAGKTQKVSCKKKRSQRKRAACEHKAHKARKSRSSHKPVKSSNVRAMGRAGR